MTPRHCELVGCPRLAEPGRRFCAAHRKRLQRQRPALSEPLALRYADPRELLRRAALAYADADADSDQAYLVARRRLNRAVQRLHARKR